MINIYSVSAFIITVFMLLMAGVPLYGIIFSFALSCGLTWLIYKAICEGLK